MQRNPNYGTLFEKWEIETAEYWAGRFSDLRGYDTDDLIQECLIKWLDVRKHRKALHRKFMSTVLRNFLLNIKEQLQAEKRRTDIESQSMDKCLFDEKNVLSDELLTLHDTVGKSDRYLENIPLRLDVHRALQKLSPKHLNLCQLILNKGMRIDEIASVLKSHRSTIYREIEHIKKFFDKEGLRESMK